MDRRRVMIAIDGGRAVVVGLLGAILVVGQIDLVVVYVVAFLLGSAETMFDTSAEAIIPSLVGVDSLDSANGRLQATEWATNSFVGPPFGAALFALAVSVPFLFNAGSFVVAAVLVATIGGSYGSLTPAEDTRSGIRTEISAGIRWMWGHKVLRTLAVMAGINNLVGTGLVAVFVLFAQDILGLGDIGYGVVLAVMGVGGLAGALSASAVARKIGQGTTMLTSVLLMALAALILGTASNAFVAAAASGLFGFVIGMWNVVAVSLRQRITPDPLRGRVASVARLLAWGTQPLGALLGGVVASGFERRSSWLAPSGLRCPCWSDRS